MVGKDRRYVDLQAKGEIQFSNYAWDTFVAPKMSELTEVGAPDLPRQAKGWVNNFILNSALRLGKKYPYRQLLLHILRKVEGALQEYQEAREFLEEYVANKKAASSYFHALRHFETTALLTYHAYDTYATLIEKKFFRPADGTPLQRLNHIQNKSKHAQEDMGKAKCPDDFTVAVWLTNAGMECYDNTVLRFSELAELLTDLTVIADKIASPRVR